MTYWPIWFLRCIRSFYLSISSRENKRQYLFTKKTWRRKRSTLPKLKGAIHKRTQGCPPGRTHWSTWADDPSQIFVYKSYNYDVRTTWLAKKLVKVMEFSRHSNDATSWSWNDNLMATVMFLDNLSVNWSPCLTVVLASYWTVRHCHTVETSLVPPEKMLQEHLYVLPSFRRAFLSRDTFPSL